MSTKILFELHLSNAISEFLTPSEIAKILKIPEAEVNKQIDKVDKGVRLEIFTYSLPPFNHFCNIGRTLAIS